ncbi:MAG: DUF5654 family protein [Candidatus Aenigmatarchaeota archaeon]
MSPFVHLIKKFKSNNKWKLQSRGIAIKNELREFRRVFKENLITLLISSFSLVAALSWNEAIRSAITTFLPSQSEVYYKFYAALAISFLAVFITYILSKFKTS